MRSGGTQRLFSRQGRIVLALLLVLPMLLAGRVIAPDTRAATPSALRFDGTATYVKVNDSPSLRIPVNLTLEAWVKPEGVTRHQHIAGKNRYEIGIEPSGDGFIVVFHFKSDNDWKTVVSGQYPLNAWYHVAGAYDGSNMRLWVNGQRVASREMTGQIDQTDNPLRIGSANAADDYFEGIIDEVRVSNTVRYTSNFVPAQEPFVPDAFTAGLWHLDEGDGTSVADASGNGNNGKLQNGPEWVADSPFQGPDLVAPKISDVRAGNLSTSATITWTTDEPATSRVIYGPTSDYGATTLFDAALVTNHKQIITGLQLNTTYHFKVSSLDGAANATWSEDVTFTAPASAPPVPPIISGMATGAISASGATVYWSTDVPANGQVEYGTTSAYGSRTALANGNVVAHSQALSGLQPETTYHYRVSSTAANGQTTISGDGVFTTAGPDAASEGQWSAVMDWPLVAVHAVLVSSGDVLLWDAWQLRPGVAARVWNPVSETFTGVTNEFSSIFCAAHVQLADGRQIVIGGYAAADEGIPDVNIFDPATGAWTRVADMHYSRWYPTAVELGDGRVLTLGGQSVPGVYVDVPEVYDPASDTWTVLEDARLNVGEYPFVFLAPDGGVFVVADPAGYSRMLNVDTQTWSAVGTAPVATGTAAMYRPGKIIATGGGDPLETTTALIDLNSANPTWRITAPMESARFKHNLVVLPDGDVLALGGASEYNLKAMQGVLTAELWDPDTETWTTLAQMNDLRMYHSTALLLPDGRVLMAGGGRLTPTNDYYTAEIYSPPYLFKGPRPTISSAPNHLAWGETFTLQTPDAARIDSVALVTLGSNTHALNMTQRYVPLEFRSTSGGLSIEVPDDPNIAPPGDYMLFIVDEAGVPSVAKIVRVNGYDAGDRQPPSVSLAEPAAGAVVSGQAVTLSADAADNAGVASVQFLLDGAALGPLLTAAPWSYQWDTTVLPNGPHILSAIVRDAGGNTATASAVTVLVSNASSDITPPVISAVGTTNLQSVATTLVWTTDEPATSRVEWGTSPALGARTALDTELTTSHAVWLDGLDPQTTYYYRVISTDAAGNQASSPLSEFTTPSAGALRLVGNTTIEEHPTQATAGIAQAFQYVAAVSGTVDEIAVYVDAGTTVSEIVVGLYSNFGDDTPNRLLTQGTISNPLPGEWNKVAVPDAQVTGGAKYWIAVLAPTGSGSLHLRDVGAGGGRVQASSQSNLSILPSSWTVGTSSHTSPLSAFAAQSGGLEQVEVDQSYGADGSLPTPDGRRTPGVLSVPGGAPRDSSHGYDREQFLANQSEHQH